MEALPANETHVIGNGAPPPAPTTALPWWLKYGYTAFASVLLVYYWREYGATNFFYFCDVAVFLAVAAVWTKKPIFASMAAVGISIPQLLWQADFIGSIVGFPLTGMTDYMFDTSISRLARSLSFFHFWLPMLLWYLVWRLGYDRRALIAWTVVAWALMLIAYFLLPAPGEPLSFPNQPFNVNYVFGPDNSVSQSWMPASAWLACLLIGLPLFFYLPAHVALAWMDRLHRRKAVAPVSPAIPGP